MFFYNNHGKKRLLIVTETFTFGGLETQIAGQIKELHKKKWKIWVIVGKNYKPGLMPVQCTEDVVAGLNFASDSTPTEFLETVDYIARFIKKNKIDVVHAHPYMSSLPAYMATNLTKRRYVLTVHGTASIGGVFGSLYDKINKHIIENSNVIVISQCLLDVRMKEFGCYPKSVHCLPNGVEIINKANNVREIKEVDKARVLVISRLDKEKVPGIKEFIKMGLASGLSCIDVAGDGPNKEELNSWCRNSDYADKVKLLGAIYNVKEVMCNYDLVGGMGRVVLESASQGLPTVLIGYDGVKGMIKDVADISKYSYDNFTGREMLNINSSRLKKEYNSLDLNLLSKIKRYIIDNYSEDKIWERFVEIINTTEKSNDATILELYDALRNIQSTDLLSKTWINSETLSKLFDEFSVNSHSKNLDL